MDIIADPGIIYCASSLFRPRRLATTACGGVFLSRYQLGRRMWRLEGGTAHLDIAWLAAEVNLVRPQEGLRNICIDGEPIGNAGILQVRTPEVDPDDSWRLAEGYVRGADLVASYAQTGQWNVRPQIYWRAVRQDDERAVGVELIASVQTSLQDSDPSTVIGSTLPSSDVWQLTDQEESRFEPVALADAESFVVESGAAAGLFLFRLPDVSLSYVEMIHAADFITAEVAKQADRGIRSAFRLFDERLEKGVIRRARLRGVFVPRESDQQDAVESYHHFVRSAVPLTA
jgi:hypothetical protein